MREEPFNNAPIGIFDSGFGGLTVARQVMKTMPDEDIIYFGDSARCPYGPRSQKEVDGFVQQICRFLLERQVKLILIACNTATAAGLRHAQQTFDVPILGVIGPGARGTVESGSYTKAIRGLDAGITVFSVATPRFVEIAEQGIRMADGPIENYTSTASKVYVRPEFQEIAQDYLDPLRRCDIDTLVLGCTHFPLLKALIGSVAGRKVTLIDSAKEAARDVHETLSRRGDLAEPGREPNYEFFTTGSDLDEFRRFGSRVLQMSMTSVSHVDL